MKRIKEEQFDFLRLNNLQDKVNFNKKANPSNWILMRNLCSFHGPYLQKNLIISRLYIINSDIF